MRNLFSLLDSLFGQKQRLFLVEEEFLDLSFSEKMDDVLLGNSSDLKRKIDSDNYSIITGASKGLENDWFDAVVSTMESCDIIESIILEELFEEDCLPVRRYASHNRSKDLWATEWGQMIITLKTIAEGSWARRKFRRRFRVPFDYSE